VEEEGGRERGEEGEKEAVCLISELFLNLMCVCVYVCMYVCMCVCICIYI